MTVVVWITLAAMGTVTAWFFGGVRTSTQSWLLAGAATVSVCCLLMAALDRARTNVVLWAFMPLAGGVILGLIQLVPLDTPLREILSPVGSELQSQSASHQLADDATGKAMTGLPSHLRRPITLYPASTRHDVAMLLLAMSVFVASALRANSPSVQLGLCALLATNGALLSLLGVIQQASYNGQLYWVQPLADGGKPFASFVNRNNAGGYLNLCLAGAVGLTVWVTGRFPALGAISASLPGKDRLGRLARWKQTLAGFAANLDGMSLLAITLLCSIAAGVVCTLSRGAAVAMLGATLISVLSVMKTRRRHLVSWQWLVLAAVGAGLLVMWVGQDRAVRSRYASLLAPRAIATESRLLHWKNSIKAVPDYWRAGSGLGTYRYVYPRYETESTDGWFFHAENQYLEAVVETGVLGLCLLVAALVIVGLAARDLVGRSVDRRGFAFGVAGVFALSSQVIHAFFDFGLYLPANMVLFSLVCGSIVGGAARLRRDAALDCCPKASSRQLVPCALWLLLVVGTTWGWMETRKLAPIEQVLAQCNVRPTDNAWSAKELRETIHRLEPVLRRRPDDARAQYRLGQLYTHLFRVLFLSELEAEGPVSVEPARLWEATGPAMLHGRAYQLLRAGGPERLDWLASDPLVRSHLAKARNHFLRARSACPAMPKVHLRLAELAFVSSSLADDVEHLKRVRELAPADPDLRFACGVLEFHAGRCGIAFADWNSSLAQSPRHLGQIVLLSRDRLTPEELITSVIPDSPALLLQLARDHYRSEHQARDRLLIAQRAESLLDESTMAQRQLDELRGSAYALQLRYDEAIAAYKRALMLQSDNIQMRCRLARLLQQAGKHKEARRQAQLCVQMAPRNRQCQKLLQSLTPANGRYPAR